MKEEENLGPFGTDERDEARDSKGPRVDFSYAIQFIRGLTALLGSCYGRPQKKA